MAEYLSRSEMKRIYKQVEELAKEVADLSDKELRSFPGGPVIHEEIMATRGLKGGSKKRQVKYLAKVLRQGPMDEIYLYVTNRKGSDLHAKKQSHKAERLRDSLINEAMELRQKSLATQTPFEPDYPSEFIGDIVESYAFKEQELRQVIHNYVCSHNKQYYRELFRIIKAAVEHQERGKI